jgi:hypothetical protein
MVPSERDESPIVNRSLAENSFCPLWVNWQLLLPDRANTGKKYYRFGSVLDTIHFII